MYFQMPFLTVLLNAQCPIWFKQKANWSWNFILINCEETQKVSKPQIPKKILFSFALN